MVKKPMTARELLEQLERDPEYVARRQRLDDELKRKAEEYAQAEAPAVAALNLVGAGITSISDLVNTNKRYPALAPVLFDELAKPHPPTVRGALARALAVAEARPFFDGLVRLFLAESDNSSNGLKWCIHLAIAAASDVENQYDLIKLALDRRHGRNRALFVDALARINTAETRAALHELEDDPDLEDDFKRLSKRRAKVLYRPARHPKGNRRD